MAEMMIIVLGIVFAAGAFVKGGPAALVARILKWILVLIFRATIAIARVGLAIVR